MENSISVIGGDLRSVKLIELLSKEKKVYTYGFDTADDIMENSNIEFCKDYKDAIKKSNVIIAPIPFSGDKKNLLMTFCEQPLLISDFMNCIDDKVVIGGNFTEDIRKKFEEKNVKYIDVIKREEFSVLNAISTAEGTIEIILRETQRTLHGSKVLVMGFGRVGKVLSDKLAGMGAKVYCEARKNEDIAWIKAYGYNPIELKDLDNYIGEFEIIVNTIPYEVLNKEKLNLVRSDVLLIDLASNPGGIDRNVAKEKKLKFIWALSLPGKVAPVTSAEFIKETLDNALEELF